MDVHPQQIMDGYLKSRTRNRRNQAPPYWHPSNWQNTYINTQSKYSLLPAPLNMYNLTHHDLHCNLPPRHLNSFAQARNLLINLGLGVALGAPSWNMEQNSDRQCPWIPFMNGSWFKDWWKSFSCDFCYVRTTCIHVQQGMCLRLTLAEYVRAERLWFQPCCPSQCLPSNHSLFSLLLPVSTVGCTPRPSRQCSTEISSINSTWAVFAGCI